MNWWTGAWTTRRWNGYAARSWRWTGCWRCTSCVPDAFVDVDVLVNPALSVSEGHRIGQEVLSRLNREIEEVVDVTVHVDPEDDETHAPCGHIPLRGEMLRRLHAHWREIPGADQVEAVTLHYLDGKVRVEARVPLAAVPSLDAARRFSRTMAETADKDEFVSEVRVLFG